MAKDANAGSDRTISERCCVAKGAVGQTPVPRKPLTHVSRTQPQVEGAAMLLTLLDGQNPDRWKTLPHHQPARHSNTLKHQQHFSVKSSFKSRALPPKRSHSVEDESARELTLL